MFYINKVSFQASLTEQKTEAVDALKGKVEFVKNHQSHAIVNNTINNVEDILNSYTRAFADVADAEDKAVRMEIAKATADIEKILSKPAFGKLTCDCFNTNLQ